MKKFLSIIMVMCFMLLALAACTDAESKEENEEPITDKEDDITQNEDSSHKKTEPDADLKDENNAAEEDKKDEEIKIPEGLTGVDIAKLLLASDRLGGRLVDENDKIFAGSEEVLTTLSSRAQKNLALPMIMLNVTDTACLAGSTTRLSGTEITEFTEMSRNFAEFENTTERIVSLANSALEMITYVKKNMRIVDTWVKVDYGNDEMYLSVSENSETIIKRSEGGEQIFICMRYKNEHGEDVYEIYEKNPQDAIRSSYIAGKKYEMMYSMGGGQRYQGISANKDKGYWEIFDMIYDSNWVEYQFDTNFIIMKDDICYKAGYSMREGSGVNYTITSPDRKVDIMLISENENSSVYDISLAAFSGYYGVVDIQPGAIGKLKLADGTLIDETFSKTYFDGQCRLNVNAIRASESAFGKEGTVMVQAVSEDASLHRKALVMLLEEWGFKSKYDFEQIFASVGRASEEFVAMKKYLKWNGHDVNSIEGLMLGVEAEKDKFESMAAIYDAVKEKTVITIDGEAAALLMKFAEIKEISSSGVKADSNKVTVEKISLSVDDMLLFVKNEKYKVAFAMKSLGEDGGLTHIETSVEAVAYDGGSILALSVEKVTFELPILEEGEYTLVAYIATEDGIRSSACIDVSSVSVENGEFKNGNMAVKLSADNGILKAIYTETIDANATVYRTGETPYAAFCELMEEAAFAYGLPMTDTVRRFNPDTKEETALSGDETDVELGIYCISYTVSSGEDERVGVLYVKYAENQVEEQDKEIQVTE